MRYFVILVIGIFLGIFISCLCRAASSIDREDDGADRNVKDGRGGA